MTLPSVSVPVLLGEANGAAVYHADWRGLLDVVPTCDLLCVDAPYSERTHSKHDGGADDANGDVINPDVRDNRERMRLGIGAIRRKINYSAWTAADIDSFVAAWSPRVSGWFVSITDYVLAPIWQAAFEAVGRYAFAPLPYVAPGSRVRLTGDGPSNWTTWIVAGGSEEAMSGMCEAQAQIVVARPKTKEMARWGTLPGAYILPPGQGGSMPVVGGKPVWLASELVSHYSRPGGLCVDPCSGAGTLAVGAIRTGRRAIVGDALLAHAELGAQWIREPWRPAPGIERDPVGSQLGMFSPR